ncbi:PPC domain-containing protein [Planctomycetales bacterium 10988]|nr:PPC domain-containing protein [Planctomycetales bacterium 10988]
MVSIGSISNSLLCLPSTSCPLRVVRISLLMGLLCLVTNASRGQLPRAELDAVFPAGGKQGTTVEVRADGSCLEGAESLLFSHEGITAQPKRLPPDEIWPQGTEEIGAFTVAIDPGVPPGIYEVRVLTECGLSNPRRFVVSQQPEILRSPENTTLQTAQVLPIGTIVNGQIKQGERQFFRFTAEEGEKLIVRCWAEQIDSRLDPVLSLLSSDGKEITRNNDFFSRDPLLVFRTPVAGEYVLRLQDFLFQGNEEYFYRLEISRKPAIEWIFPPSGLPGTESQATIFGYNLPSGEPATEFASLDRPLVKQAMTIRWPERNTADLHSAELRLNAPELNLRAMEFHLSNKAGRSNPVLLGVAAAPITFDHSDNEQPEKAQPISPPCEIVGQFFPIGDEDWYTFEAKKGEVYWIEVISQRLHLPTDPYLLIQQVEVNEQGEEQIKDLKEVDDLGINRGNLAFDTRSDDPGYRLEIPQDGAYRLLIRDLYHGLRGDPRFVYRLQIHQAEPDFQLAAFPTTTQPNQNQADRASSHLSPGGTTAIQVVGLREDGFQGEIEIVADGLPAGVRALPCVIGGEQDYNHLLLEATSDTKPWAGKIRILGKAVLQQPEGSRQFVTREARYATIIWPTFPNQITGGTRLAHDLMLSVDGESAAFRVEVAEETKLIAPRAGSLEIPLKITRHDGLKEKLTLQPMPNLDKSIQVAQVTVPPGKEEAKLTVNLRHNTPVGRTSFYLWATSTVQYQGNQETLVRYREAYKRSLELTSKHEKPRQEIQAKLDQLDKDLRQQQNAVRQKENRVKNLPPENPKLAEAKAELNKEREQLATTKAEQEKLRAELKIAEQGFSKAIKAQQDLKKILDRIEQRSKPRKIANVIYPVASVVLEVLPLPLKVTIQPQTLELTPGGTKSVQVRCERRFGFDEKIELTWRPLENIPGTNVQRATLEKDQQEQTLDIQVGAEVPADSYDSTIELEVRYRNQTLKHEYPLTLQVSAPTEITTAE